MNSAYGYDKVDDTAKAKDQYVDTQAAPTRRPSTLEEAEKRVAYHHEQAERSSRAAAFLRSNPAFDEFLLLVRSGVIRIF